MAGKVDRVKQDSRLGQDRLVIEVSRLPEIDEFWAKFRHKPEMRHNGKTSDEAVNMLLIIASSTGLSGNKEKYTIVTIY